MERICRETLKMVRFKEKFELKGLTRNSDSSNNGKFDIRGVELRRVYCIYQEPPFLVSDWARFFDYRHLTL